jgi:hypothetical protein
MLKLYKGMTCLLLCAWILWSESYFKKEKQPGAVIIGAFNALLDCDRSLERLIERRKKEGFEVDAGTVHYSKDRFTALICLPDTVKLN